MGAHWSFGPVLQPYKVRGNPETPPPSQPDREDVLPSLVASDPEDSPQGIRFFFPSYDPVTQQAPAETRVYFQPDGASAPSTPDEFIARNYPFTASSTSIGPSGDPDYVVPHPMDLPEGEYIARTLCYFAE